MLRKFLAEHSNISNMSTVYINSYSTVKLEKDPTARARLASTFPSIPPSLTLYCHHWRAPSADVCRQYSGISAPVKEFVRGSRTAMGDMYVCLTLVHTIQEQEIWKFGLMENSDQAVTNITTHLSAGNGTASIHTTCHACTYRSDAAAEIIRGKILSRGVDRVVVVHAHRQETTGGCVLSTVVGIGNFDASKVG
jgi:hypothetical protein